MSFSACTCWLERRLKVGVDCFAALCEEGAELRKRRGRATSVVEDMVDVVVERVQG